MVSLLDLPNELLCLIFDCINVPYDYYQLRMTHPSFYRIGQSFNTRYSFFYRVLVENGNSTTIDEIESIQHQHPLYRSTLCQLLASSPIPLSSVFATTLLKLVPTSHFFDFSGYPNLHIKKEILQALSVDSTSYQLYHHQQHPPHRHHHRTSISIDYNNSRSNSNSNSNYTFFGKLTIPTLVNNTLIASAKMCNRHHAMDGSPRRVYYQVTLQNTMETTASTISENHGDDNNNKNDKQDSSTVTNIGTTSPLSSPDNTLFALIHDTDTVIGIDKEIRPHYGKLWYEDEGIITDSSWTQLLDVGHTTTRPEYRKLDLPQFFGRQDYCKPYHRGWRPCLLQTLYQCRLKRNVRKGGLKKGDVFDCVFVYEHREDDTICMEFCQWNNDRQQWTPQGFLLFAEHHIAWSS